jgi:hypothetical protein
MSADVKRTDRRGALGHSLDPLKTYRVDLPDNRAAPTIPPSADSITTATSSPSGNRSLISRGLPNHSPTERIDRTTLDSARVRPPFSPRPIFVVCSWSNPTSMIFPRPTPDPILIATISRVLSTLSFAATRPKVPQNFGRESAAPPCPPWVIRDRSGVLCCPAHFRFAPKADVRS